MKINLADLNLEQNRAGFTYCCTQSDWEAHNKMLRRAEREWGKWHAEQVKHADVLAAKATAAEKEFYALVPDADARVNVP